MVIVSPAPKLSPAEATAEICISWLLGSGSSSTSGSIPGIITVVS